MANTTEIAFAHATFNPWIGCCHAMIPGTTKLHPGCLHCYAEAQQGRYGVTWGPNGTRRRTADSTWKHLLTWNSKAARGICDRCYGSDPDCSLCGGKREPYQMRVFCSLCDPFEDWDGHIRDASGALLLVCDNCGKYHRDDESALTESCTCSRFKQRMEWAEMSDLRRDLFSVVDKTQNLTWILSTKRPQNIRLMWRVDGNGQDPGYEDYLLRRNVHLLYSACDQQTYDAGLPYLMGCADLVPVRGVILEPLIGPVNLRLGDTSTLNLNWVIVGGESGPKARPCDVAWIRSIVRQCKAAGVRVFVKQLGADVYDHDTTSAAHFDESECWPKGTTVDYHRILLKHKKGGDPAEWPEDVRVQELAP